MFRERFLAYLIDIIIVFILMITVYSLFGQNPNIVILDNQIAELSQSFLDKVIDSKEYITQYSSINAQKDFYNAPYSLLNAVIILLHFVIMPFYNKGQTIGKKILKIKVETVKKKKTSIDQLLIRSFITTGLLYLLVSLGLLYLLDANTYFLVTSILGFIQIILVFTSIFMILCRRDKKGIEDLITNTLVTRRKR
jgi:uncharacterized RDD family membrane protein YckC